MMFQVDRVVAQMSATQPTGILAGPSVLLRSIWVGAIKTISALAMLAPRKLIKFISVVGWCCSSAPKPASFLHKFLPGSKDMPPQSIANSCIPKGAVVPPPQFTPGIFSGERVSTGGYLLGNSLKRTTV